MFCPKCGNQVQDGAAFCPKCGTNLEGHAQQAQQQQPSAQGQLGPTGQPAGQAGPTQPGQPTGYSSQPGTYQAPGLATQPQSGVYGAPSGSVATATAKKPLGGKLPILIVAIAAVVVVLLVVFLVVKPGGSGANKTVDTLLNGSSRQAADVLNGMYQIEVDSDTAYTDNKELANLFNDIASDSASSSELSDLSAYDGAGLYIPLDSDGNTITSTQVASGTKVGAVGYVQLRFDGTSLSSQETIDAIDAAGTSYDHILAASYNTLSLYVTDVTISAFYGKDYYGVGGFAKTNTGMLTNGASSQDCGVLIVCYANYGVNASTSLLDDNSDEQFNPDSYDAAQNSWQSFVTSVNADFWTSDVAIK